MNKNQISIIFLALTLLTTKLDATEEIDKYKKEISTSYADPAFAIRRDPLSTFPVEEHHKSKSVVAFLSFLDQKDYQGAFVLPDVYLMIHMYQQSPSGGMAYTVMNLNKQKEVRTYLIDFIEQYSQKLVEKGLKDGVLGDAYAYVQVYKNWAIPVHEINGNVVGHSNEGDDVTRHKKDIIRNDKEGRRATREANVNEWLNRICDQARVEVENIARVVQVLTSFPDLQAQERAKALAIINSFPAGDARRAHIQNYMTQLYLLLFQPFHLLQH